MLGGASFESRGVIRERTSVAFSAEKKLGKKRRMSVGAIGLLYGKFQQNLYIPFLVSFTVNQDAGSSKNNFTNK